MNQFDREFFADYGVFPDAGGARAFTRRTLPSRDHKIASAGMYVGVCRRVARERGIELPIDGRLIAVGFNHVPPSKWIYGPLDEFIAYYCDAVPRPSIVGSPYNSSPEQVYIAMRCGIPAKIVERLHGRGIPKKIHHVGRSELRRLIRIARAMSRVSASSTDFLWVLSDKAVEALGRLCPELQAVALKELITTHRDTIWSSGRVVTTPEGSTKVAKPFRVRDLPWEAVAEAQRKLVADKSGRVRALMAKGKRRVSLCGGHVSSFLAPAFPIVPEEVAEMVAQGKSPLQIAREYGDDPDTDVTPADAHAWMVYGAPSNLTVWRTLRIQSSVGVQGIRSLTIAQWIDDVKRRGQWGLLLAPRRIPGPAGAAIEYRYIDRIDEIQEQDLTKGIQTPVRVAFDSAARRTVGASLEKLARDYRVLRQPPGAWRFSSRVTPLVTAASLVREGRELNPCVGGYASAVESGRSVILSIRVGSHRSTAEITTEGQVLQHRAQHNATPHRACQMALESFLRRSRLSERKAA